MFKLRRYPKGLHTRLQQSGWFSRGIGPLGGCPVQLFGQLTTGEFVYFRARGEEVTMEIFQRGSKPHKCFSEQVFVDHPLGTGVLPTEQAVAMIERWLTEYQGEKPYLKQAREKGKVTTWWAGLGHKILCGLSLNFAVSSENRWGIVRKGNMLHNGNRPVDGLVLQAGLLQLQLSSARHWE